jgi:hypothetical protein
MFGAGAVCCGCDEAIPLKITVAARAQKSILIFVIMKLKGLGSARSAIHVAELLYIAKTLIPIEKNPIKNKNSKAFKPRDQLTELHGVL